MLLKFAHIDLGTHLGRKKDSYRDPAFRALNTGARKLHLGRPH